MYKDTRPADAVMTTASTPEMWAINFAMATPLNWRKTFRLRRSKEWSLIRTFLPPGARVLDAGCGFGEWVTFMRREGMAAEGVDYSSELIRRLEATYPETRWACSRIQSMPYADGTFDGVISWGVVEHDEDGPSKALRELFRVM